MSLSEQKKERACSKQSQQKNIQKIFKSFEDKNQLRFARSNLNSFQPKGGSRPLKKDAHIESSLFRNGVSKQKPKFSYQQENNQGNGQKLGTTPHEIRSSSSKAIKFPRKSQGKSISSKKIQINKLKSSFSNLDLRYNFGSPKEVLTRQQKPNKLVLNESPVYNVKNLKINFFKIIKKKKEKSQQRKDSVQPKANRKPSKQPDAQKSSQNPSMQNFVYDMKQGIK